MSSFRSTRIYGAEEIELFLRSVDRHLANPVTIVIIGGSAAALAHGVTSTTTDVDTISRTTAELDAAVHAACEETGLRIPLRQSDVADAPYHYEDRLERHLPELRRLQVWVLEKHDLVLSKVIRYVEHDAQQIREMFATVGLSFETLVERYRDEMSHVVGDPRRIRGNFLTLIDELFGELKRVAAERALLRPKK